MARVNSIESYEFLKNLPSKNPNNFAAVDKDKSQVLIKFLECINLSD